MKTLLILRHAKSSWKHENLADHDRPLKKRGKTDAIKMGEHLRKQVLRPDFIISWTAKRARTTAKLVAEACHYEDDIRETRTFYQADTDDYIGVLRQLDDGYDRVMVVGHNPTLEALLETLTGAVEWMPSGALAHVSLPIDTWRDLSDDTHGQLVNLWIPRALV